MPATAAGMVAKTRKTKAREHQSHPEMLKKTLAYENKTPPDPSPAPAPQPPNGSRSEPARAEKKPARRRFRARVASPAQQLPRAAALKKKPGTPLPGHAAARQLARERASSLPLEPRARKTKKRKNEDGGRKCSKNEQKKKSGKEGGTPNGCEE